MREIVERIALLDVMTELAQRRSVFHSEADFQHAFGQVLHDLAPDVHVRLEVRQPGTGKAEYLDLLCRDKTTGGRTAIEFKYFTAGWRGTDPLTDEEYQLRMHAAMDLARLHFVSDIERLERFRDPHTNGLAVMLSNAKGLWQPPTAPTRDHQFRIHEGAELGPRLTWGSGDYPANDRILSVLYRASWRPFSNLPGNNGEFQWLGISVQAGSSAIANV